MLHIVFGGVALYFAQRSAALRPTGAVLNKIEAPGATYLTGASQTDQCTSLIDHDTYFTVKITVGTAEFEVIPDTGSNTVIVPSCTCAKKGGGCPKSDACLPKDRHLGSEEIPMTFGSGTIYGFEENVDVSIGMDDVLSTTSGALIMSDRNQLAIRGPFEGILGLGVPNAYPEDSEVGLTEFLIDSKTRAFSVCFGDPSTGEGEGVLRFGSPAPDAKAFPNIGTEHWAVDFRGISVGAASQSVRFCKTDDMLDGQETPCAAIPDSGTTLLLGPQMSINNLIMDICDGWERCQDVQREKGVEAFEAIGSLMADCDSFDSSELPDLYFRFGAGGGKEELLALPGSMYVFKSEAYGCELAFDALEYNTAVNGDVWVLGQALFNHYVVSFELGKNSHRISFSSLPCGSCEDNFLRSSGSQRVQRRTRRVLRGQKRRPFINTSLPL